MKLTKLQRFTAYCIMMAWFEENNWRFFCEAMREVFGLPFSSQTIKEYFPELYRKRPTGKDGEQSWFGNNSPERKKLLKQCIEETHP